MYVFFFSSRRRHTRWPRDWSSDVCSSDLTTPSPPSQFQRIHVPRQTRSNQRSPSSPTTPPRHPPPNPTPNPPTTNLEPPAIPPLPKRNRLNPIHNHTHGTAARVGDT